MLSRFNLGGLWHLWDSPCVPWLFSLRFFWAGLGRPKARFCYPEMWDYYPIFCPYPLPSAHWNPSSAASTIPHPDSSVCKYEIQHRVSPLGSSDTSVRKLSSKHYRNLLIVPCCVSGCFNSPWGLEGFANMKLLLVDWRHNQLAICNKQEKSRTRPWIHFHLQYSFIFAPLEFLFNNKKGILTSA